MRSHLIQWFVVLEIVLFFGIAFVPCINALNDDRRMHSLPPGNILYVGGSGQGNYTRIQDALDNASDGDTIFVYSGIYGRFQVRKQVQIIGEHKQTTIIDGKWGYNSISVETNNFRIRCFTVIRGVFGISIQGWRDVDITDMILTNNDVGIMHNYNKEVHIEQVYFHDNKKAMDIWDPLNCSVAHCIFESNGIYHAGYPSGGANSMFFSNNIFSNGSTLSLGGFCIDSHGVTKVESNIFQNNNVGIATNTCKGVLIKNNNFINNTQHIRLLKISPFIRIPFYIKYKQDWQNNYWDDKGPMLFYSIQGCWEHPYFPILKFSIREYDWDPALQPFDIKI